MSEKPTNRGDHLQPHHDKVEGAAISNKLAENTINARSGTGVQDHARVGQESKKLEANGTLPPCSIGEMHVKPCQPHQPGGVGHEGTEAPKGNTVTDQGPQGAKRAPGDQTTGNTADNAGTPGQKQEPHDRDHGKPEHERKKENDRQKHHDGSDPHQEKHHDKLHDRHHHRHHKKHHHRHHKPGHGKGHKGAEGQPQSSEPSEPNNEAGEPQTAAPKPEVTPGAGPINQKPGDATTGEQGKVTPGDGNQTNPGKLAPGDSQPGTAGKPGDLPKGNTVTPGDKSVPGTAPKDQVPGKTDVDGCPSDGSIPKQSFQDFLQSVKMKTQNRIETMNQQQPGDGRVQSMSV